MKRLDILAAASITATLFVAPAQATVLPVLNEPIVLKATEFVNSFDHTGWNQFEQSSGNEGSNSPASVDIGTLNGTKFPSAPEEVRNSNVTFIGYTQAGEWLEYELQVSFAGNYRVNAFTASPNSDPTKNGALDVSFTSHASGNVVSVADQLEQTNSWYDFQTMDLGEVPLEAGLYTVRVAITEKGLNLYGLGLAESFPETTLAYEDFSESIGFSSQTPLNRLHCVSWNIWDDDPSSRPAPSQRSAILMAESSSMTGTFPSIKGTVEGQAEYPTDVHVKIKYEKNLANDPAADSDTLDVYYGTSSWQDITPAGGVYDPQAGVIRYVATASIPQSVVESGADLDFFLFTNSPNDANFYSIKSIELTGVNTVPATQLLAGSGPEQPFFRIDEGSGGSEVVNSDVLLNPSGLRESASNGCLTIQHDPYYFTFTDSTTTIGVNSGLTGSAPLLHTAMADGMQKLVFVTRTNP